MATRIALESKGHMPHGRKVRACPASFHAKLQASMSRFRCWIIFVFYFFSFHIGPKARYSNVWLLNRSGYSRVWSRHENRKSAHTTADGRLGTNIRLCCSCLRPCVSRRPALLTLQTPRSLHCTTPHRHDTAWPGTASPGFYQVWGPAAGQPAAPAGRERGVRAGNAVPGSRLLLFPWALARLGERRRPKPGGGDDAAAPAPTAADCRLV